MRGGIAEVGKDAVTQELGDIAVETLDLAGATLLKPAHDVALLFRIKAGRERG
jgi:hypothetical protein